MLQCVAVCRSVLQCVAVWCSELQFGAVCCCWSLLWWVQDPINQNQIDDELNQNKIDDELNQNKIEDELECVQPDVVTRERWNYNFEAHMTTVAGVLSLFQVLSYMFLWGRTPDLWLHGFCSLIEEFWKSNDCAVKTWGGGDTMGRRQPTKRAQQARCQHEFEKDSSKGDEVKYLVTCPGHVSSLRAGYVTEKARKRQMEWKRVCTCECVCVRGHVDHAWWSLCQYARKPAHIHASTRSRKPHTHKHGKTHAHSRMHNDTYNQIRNPLLRADCQISFHMLSVCFCRLQL